MYVHFISLFHKWVIALSELPYYCVFQIHFTAMKLHVLSCLSALLFAFAAVGQQQPTVTSAEALTDYIALLSSDSLQGRRTFSPGLHKAGNFIAAQFKAAGIRPWAGATGYLQPFTMVTASPQQVAIRWGGKQVPAEYCIGILSTQRLHFNGQTALAIDSITNKADFQAKISGLLHPQRNTLVWISSDLQAPFASLRQYLSGQAVFEGSPSVVFILADHFAGDFDIRIQNKVESLHAANVLGVLPGKSKPEEYIIFSAHYDHLGTDGSLKGDTIYNGANDDASGCAAVMALARYFGKKGGNARSLVFVTFAGEEEGGYGSRYFSRQLDPAKVIAMVNIEMIGTPSKWGKNAAYLTGFEQSSLGRLLQRNLGKGAFSLHPDPYPKAHLFYRSDNATLARLGVPAHTISTAQMDAEPHYHQVSDEIGTLDINNMVSIVQGIATGVQGLVDGTDTPSRVQPENLSR